MFDSQVQVAERSPLIPTDDVHIEVRSSTKPQPAAEATAPMAAKRYVPLPLRGDTFLGVCEAIGEDFGFNPNYLRVLLASGILFSPALVIGVYLALGAAVALSRYFFPRIRAEAAAVDTAA